MMQPRVDAGGAQRDFVARRGMLAVVMLLLPVLAHAQAGGVPKDNPRLASLNIEIWPEYDRPAVLVILRAALPEGVNLPAAVTLRLPAASGGASSVAYSATAEGSLLNLKHERASTGEFVTLKFETPQRFFHVEFYEPIATADPARSFRYVWPGDLAAERVTVVVQEPASASALSVEPNLDGTSTGQDGLRYRAAELGALEAGKPLPIAVRYTKPDARPTTDILKLKTGDSNVSAAAPPPALASPPPAAAATGLPYWALPMAGLVLFGLPGGVFVLWWSRRASPPVAPAPRTCAKCGALQPPGNRFCGNCGSKIA
jgi:hypothetical protein